MGTTTDKLNHLIATKEVIRGAIIAKGVSVANTDTFRSYASKIAAIPQEGGGTTTQPSAGAVTFRDYDGTVLHAYSKDEFLALTAMPALPTQPKLTCQGWNYTLEDAQAYVEEYGVLEVGATYITDDGKTRLYITIAAEGRMDVPLRFSQSVSEGVVIDWGDGGAVETIGGTGKVKTTHTYKEVGDYIISLDVVDGCVFEFGAGSSSYCTFGSTSESGTVYRNMLRSVELGKNIQHISSYAFYRCRNLKSITLHNSVKTLQSYSLSNCGLDFISIPNSVTSLLSNVFNTCYNIVSVSIPYSVTSIGDRAFAYTYLMRAIIPNSGITMGSEIFQYCRTLEMICLPNSITSISVGLLYQCESLALIVIPEGVTQINNSAFYNCYGMAICDFTKLTAIPALSNTGAFTKVPSDCKIIVPDALYDSWIAASNWSTYASRIIKASEYNG